MKCIVQRFVADCTKNFVRKRLVKRVTELTVPKKNLVLVFPYLDKFLFSDGFTIKIPYGVDVLLNRPASYPIFSYWVG